MANFAKVVLIFGVQILLGYASIRGQMARITWIEGGCWLAMVVVPFIGYISVLYRAPTRLASSPAGRMALLTLLSFFMTFFGAILSYVILAMAGMPVRG